MKKPKLMTSKIIVSGDTVEIYEYSSGILYDYEQKSSSERSELPPDSWDGKRSDNLRRARQAIRRYIWANLGKFSKFFTLTYADNMQDYDQFKKDWHRFIQNMRRKGFNLRYLYVLEHQERGAIHAHVVVFNDEYIPQEILTKAWGRGFVKINSIKDVKNLGAYVCKYLTKETVREYGSYSYHVSRGLIKSNEIKIALGSRDTVKDYQAVITASYQNEYSITHCGEDGKPICVCTVKYTQGRFK